MLQTTRPQGGEEQVKTPSQVLGPIRAQGEWKEEASCQLPAACPSAPGPSLHPAALTDMGQAFITDQRLLGARHCAGRENQGVTASMETLLWGS